MKLRKPLAALLATVTMAALAVTSGAATATAIENPMVTVHLDQSGCTANTITPIAKSPTVRPASCMV